MNRFFKLLAPDRFVGAVAVAAVLMCMIAVLNLHFYICGSVCCRAQWGST